MRSEVQDRLSPLTSGSIPFLTMPASIDDPTGTGGDLEKFVDNEMEATIINPMQQVWKCQKIFISYYD